MKMRTRYNYGENTEYFYKSEQPSLTDQRYAKDADLSRIVGIDGGQLYIKDQQAFMNAVNPADYSDAFQDVSDIKDFATIQRTMKQAEYNFQELPSHVRAKYNNDLGQFLAALNQPLAEESQSVTHSPEQSEEVTPASSEGEKN